MIHPRALFAVVVVASWFVSIDAWGQFAAKGAFGPKGTSAGRQPPPSLPPTMKKSAMMPTPDRPQTSPTPTPRAQPDEAGPTVHEVQMQLGDRVEGMVDRRNPNRISFRAVAGTEVTLVLSPRDGEVVRAMLVGPDGTPVAPLVERKVGVGIGVDVELERTGLYTVAVDRGSSVCAPYVMTSDAWFPDRLVTELDLEAGRPAQVELGGFEGRRVTSILVNRRGSSDAQLTATLKRPDGTYVDLED